MPPAVILAVIVGIGLMIAGIVGLVAWGRAEYRYQRSNRELTQQVVGEAEHYLRLGMDGYW